ncbi:hypothetical protein OKW34_000151 [Paraburkholderia youngii]
MRIAPYNHRCTAPCPDAVAPDAVFNVTDSHVIVVRAAGGTPGAYPLHQSDRAARCVPRRVPPSGPLAIPFDQPRTWKKRASTVQLLPAARRRARARCLPAIFAFPAITAPDLSLQSPSSLIGSAVSQVGPQRSFAPRSRLRRLLWLPYRPMTRFACPCAPVSRLARLRPPARQYLMRVSLSGRAYRSSSVQGRARFHSDHIPHPQVRSIRRRVSGFMQRSQLRVLKGCVHACLSRRAQCRQCPTVRFTRRLIAQIWAKPPANPMDIACPGSSVWTMVHLI